MKLKLIPKPMTGEYAPYTTMYIDLLPDDGLVLKHLQDNLENTISFIRSLPDEKLTYRIAEGEWTIKEILVHIIDDERIYCYRALRYARNDTTQLPGFEQDEYVPYSGANGRELEEIIEEFASVRMATLTFFKSLDEEALTRKGVGSGNIMSVRAAAYHIAGHELHHVNSIKENYLPKFCPNKGANH
jgi:uncharacterized damage-inducible protein DinB